VNEPSVQVKLLQLRTIYSPYSHLNIYSGLAVALAAESHAAPVARTARVASSLYMSALNHLDTMLGRILNEVRDGSRTAIEELTGSSAGEREEGDDGEGESSELHGVEVGVSVRKMVSLRVKECWSACLLRTKCPKGGLIYVLELFEGYRVVVPYILVLQNGP
jgi:hypothetical protein